jgi:hypothetical protein
MVEQGTVGMLLQTKERESERSRKECGKCMGIGVTVVIYIISVSSLASPSCSIE